jgi:hypothetical protein
MLKAIAVSTSRRPRPVPRAEGSTSTQRSWPTLPGRSAIAVQPTRLPSRSASQTRPRAELSRTYSAMVFAT